MFSLLGDIGTNHVFIPAFAHRRHEKPVCPKFTAPKLLLEVWMFGEEFTGGDTFHNLYYT